MRWQIWAGGSWNVALVEAVEAAAAHGLPRHFHYYEIEWSFHDEHDESACAHGNDGVDACRISGRCRTTKLEEQGLGEARRLNGRLAIDIPAFDLQPPGWVEVTGGA